MIAWFLTGFQLMEFGVTDGLPGGLTDESDDVWMERNFSMALGFWEISYSNTHGYFHHEFS